MRNVVKLAAVGMALAMALPSQAAEVVNPITLYSGTGSKVSNNAITINDGTVKVQVTAWNTTSTNLASNNARSRGTLAMWDQGIGATYNGDSSHTIDNTGRYDFVLLQFDSAVALNTVTFASGWDGYDSDATISYANVDFAGLGLNYNSVGNAFWNAAGSQLQANATASNTPNNNFKNGVVNFSTRQVNPQLVASNVWLIGAKIGSNDPYKDAFKIKNFTYIEPAPTGAVPEPATWAMLILGMGAVGGAMRRRNRANLAFA